jgi:hypothetical protein
VHGYPAGLQAHGRPGIRELVDRNEGMARQPLTRATSAGRRRREVPYREIPASAVYVQGLSGVASDVQEPRLLAVASPMHTDRSEVQVGQTCASSLDQERFVRAAK